jgi:predicted esterase YcpF (UPF0227 family)
MKIIHLHGFASVGTGFKYDELVGTFGKDAVFSPDLPIHPDGVESLIDDIMQNNVAPNEPVVFVGTSLGGFWANYMAHKYQQECILVNPAYLPSKILVYVRGLTMFNMVTGMPFVVPVDIVQLFEKREKSLYANLKNDNVHLFLAKDDNILDHAEILKAIPHAKSINVFDDGGHGFNSHWPKVVNAAKDVLKTKG